MNHMGSPPLLAADNMNSSKRKRSVSDDPHAQTTPPTKLPKSHANHLQINYLARSSNDALPLISPDDDSMPHLLSTITAYDGILQRHESMAGNLGAKQVGLVLIKKLERLFDAPPRVLKVNGREDVTITWLDVVEFERSKPEQFKLEQMRDGVKVCQFYTKQCRVEISEDDFIFIKSHTPRAFAPSQQFEQDEEQELGTLEILEKALGNCVNLADQVAGRARHLNHKLKNRKNAIIARREAAAEETARGSVSVLRIADHGHSRQRSNEERISDSPNGGGFVAVNSHLAANDRTAHNGTTYEHRRTSSAQPNGIVTSHSASAATRAELLSKFHTKSERSHPVNDAHAHPAYSSQPTSRSSALPTKPNTKPFADSMEYAGMLLNTASPVPIPNTPSSLLPYVKPSPADRFDDSGPYKADMMARMEQLNRGDRVQPPCDRCRRLHMDCLKNLTACQGCTKKHAKCSWKDVEEQELKDHPFVMRVRTAEDMAEQERSEGEGSKSGSEAVKNTPKKELQEVRDEELLGEDSGDDDAGAAKAAENPTSRPQSSYFPGAPAFGGKLEPDKVDEVPATLSPMSRSLGATTSKFDIIRDTNPLELPSLPRKESAPHTPTTSYKIPQAQMARLPSLERTTSATSDRVNGSNDHMRTEYEKDIYSQLSEATREQTQQEQSTSSFPAMVNPPYRSSISASTRPPDDPVRFYATGVGVGGETMQSKSSNGSPARAQMNHGLPSEQLGTGRKDTTSPLLKTYGKEGEGRQMSSPPLSSMPAHAQEKVGDGTEGKDLGGTNGTRNSNGNGNGNGNRNGTENGNSNGNGSGNGNLNQRFGIQHDQGQMV